MTTFFTTPIVGQPSHGVTRYARLVASTLDGLGAPAPKLATHELAEWLRGLPHRGSPTLVHFHYSDSLFSPAESHTIACALTATQRSVRCLVTLHDVPGTGDDVSLDDHPARIHHRVNTYRDIVGPCAGVIVSNQHEADAANSWLGVAPTTIPHLIRADRARSGPTDPYERARVPPTIGIVGFIYPGKGHDRVIDACRQVPFPTRVVALGDVEAHHRDLVDELRSRAAGGSVAFDITGWLPAHELDRRLATVEVPVVAHHSPSASGTLAKWIEAGRRPIVVPNALTRELARSDPMLVTEAFDASIGSLASSICGAITAPGGTWRTEPIPHRYTAAAVRARHLRLYRDVAEQH